MPERPLVIDLYCGLGGWPEGFLAEGSEKPLPLFDKAVA